MPIHHKTKKARCFRVFQDVYAETPEEAIELAIDYNQSDWDTEEMTEKEGY